MEDGAVLTAAIEGDPRAFKTLVERHMTSVHAVAYRLMADRAEAEDVVQESFAALWKALEGRSKASPPSHDSGAWLRKVARNRALDRLRRRSRWQSDEAPSDEALIDPAMNAEQRRHASQTGDRVQAAISALPDRQRAALTLVHFEEMSQIEAAQALDISVEALESLLARARRGLRDRLGAERRDLT